MYVAERQRIPRTLWQSLADAGHVTLDLPVEFFPIKLGKSPVLWSRDEVQLWVDWCSHEFSLSNVNVTKFDMNGKALCLLTKGDFFERVPDVGDVLYNTLRTLLHKPYNKVTRGDEETFAERDVTLVRQWSRTSSDQDDRRWQERRRSAGHDSDSDDKKGGDLFETLNPVRRECDGLPNHRINGTVIQNSNVIPRNSVRADEAANLLRLNGGRVTADAASTERTLRNNAERLTAETTAVALDLSQTRRPPNCSYVWAKRCSREGNRRDEEKDSRQWIQHNQVYRGWLERNLSPCNGGGIKDERHLNTQVSPCQWSDINDWQRLNIVGDTKVTERQNPRLCETPSPRPASSPLIPPPPLSTTEPRPRTATPARSYPEVLAAYMASPIASVAATGDVKPETSGQMCSNVLSNHQPVGNRVTVGDVSAVGALTDPAGRLTDLRQPMLASFQLMPRPPDGVYCHAAQEGIGCRIDASALNIPGLPTLPHNDILEQKDSNEPMQANGRHTPDRKDGRLLWEFLSDLLLEGRQKDLIRWEDRQTRTFVIVDPAGLAAQWGKHKHRPHMTYEKMSRAMRYYYDMKIIRRMPGRRLTYSFMQEPCDIQRGVRGAKRGVPHSRRRCTKDGHVADKEEGNAGPTDNQKVHSSSNRCNATSQDGDVRSEISSEKGSVPTENGDTIPRGDCVCNGDVRSPSGDIPADGVTPSKSNLDDGQIEVSRGPGDMDISREKNIDTASVNLDNSHTRYENRDCKTITRPDDDTVDDNCSSSDCCAAVPLGNKKRQRSGASCGRRQVKKNSGAAVSTEVV